MPRGGDAPTDGERFGRTLARRFLLRGHMILMLGAVIVSGVVASTLLLRLGLRSMPVRYALAVAAAYGVFFALIALWLAYVRRVMFGARAAGSSSLGAFDLDLGSGSGSGSGLRLPRFAGGGGRFGGAGASGSFAETDVASATNVAATTTRASGSGSRGGSWLSLDLDDGGAIVIAFLVFVAVLAACGGWIVYDAPHMFGEAAFQCFLASGLLRGMKAVKADGWTALAGDGWPRVVVRRTAIPFLLVAIGAVVFGHIAQKHCPSARNVVEAFRLCVR